MPLPLRFSASFRFLRISSALLISERTSEPQRRRLRVPPPPGDAPPRRLRPAAALLGLARRLIRRLLAFFHPAQVLLLLRAAAAAQLAALVAQPLPRAVVEAEAGDLADVAQRLSTYFFFRLSHVTTERRFWMPSRSSSTISITACCSFDCVLARADAQEGVRRVDRLRLGVGFRLDRQEEPSR